MPVNFDDAIPFFGDSVAAIGPEHPKEKIQEICVWIYQTRSDGSGDVAATEMTTHKPGADQHPHFLRVDGATSKDPGRWLLPVKKIGKSDSHFENGRAVAIAIALVVEEVEGNKKQRVEWWKQQVELQENEVLTDAANTAVHAAATQQKDGEPEKELKAGGKLADPLKFKGD